MSVPRRTAIGKTGGITAFHVIVVALSFILTVTAWQYSRYQVNSRIELRFLAQRDQAIALIIDRMTKYEDALWAGVAAIESHGGDISYKDWQDFAASLRIDQRHPGTNGIGVIHFHSEDTLDAYLAQQRQERPEFRVFPEHDYEILMPITYIEPEAANATAIGLDVAHELNRRTAALASRDSGLAQITGPIVLVQDETRTPGFLFYAPFYRGDPTDMQSRQEQISGAVYAPFVVHELMAGLLAKDLRGVMFSISDAGRRIYDEHDPTDPMFDPDPLFSDQITVDLFGRSWDVDMRTNLAFRQDNTYVQPTFILLAGILIEALIVFCLMVMARAVASAKRLTAALRQESAKLKLTNQNLSRTNEELEQFSYVVSHDLRTPIRGIGGLTEMLEEDLGDYLASPEADPEVGKNLRRIKERVSRMSLLTGGIIEYSRIGADQDVSAPLEISEAVHSMRLDFELTEQQLQVNDQVGIIQVDTANLLRVLENLVGNASKYHDGARPISILVQALRIGDRAEISVSDNGPGIDPKFHGRIFEVFQTLRTPDAPESTGIGLSIVKKAIERHGGQITLRSSVGEGAVFSFDWPISKPMPSVQTSAEAA